jgi:hypothetical protein
MSPRKVAIIGIIILLLAAAAYMLLRPRSAPEGAILPRGGRAMARFDNTYAIRLVRPAV